MVLLIKAGLIFSDEGGCHVVDCVTAYPSVRYCNPYACANANTQGIKAFFNVTEYRKEVDYATLTFTVVNPPYDYYNVSYQVLVNNVPKFNGHMRGCSRPPKRVRMNITLDRGMFTVTTIFMHDVDLIDITWEAKGGFFLIDSGKCDPKSTGAFLRIRNTSTYMYQHSVAVSYGEDKSIQTMEEESIAPYEQVWNRITEPAKRPPKKNSQNLINSKTEL